MSQQSKHLFVIGAAGRVGSAIVRSAAAAGHTVTGFARNASSLADIPGVHAVTGDATSEDALAAAMAGHDAVLIAVGGRDPSVPQSIVTDVVRAAISAMKRAGVRRLITVAAAGVIPLPNGQLRGEVMLPPFLRGAFEDHRTATGLVRDSGLDFTVLCPPMVPDGAATGTYRTAIEDMPANGFQIQVGDVAHLALAVIDDAATVGKRIGLAY